MPNYLKTAYPGLKTSVLFSKQVFEDFIYLLPKSIPCIRVDHSRTEIKFIESKNNLTISLTIKISKKADIKKKISEIIKSIEDNCIYLIDKKPDNVLVYYVGSY